MAKRPLKQQVAAHEAVRRDVGRSMRDAVDASRASRSPAGRLYGPSGPRGGGPPGEPTPPSDSTRGRTERTALTPTEVRAIEHALRGGAKAHAVLAALRQAGLVAGGAKSAPPAQDRGAMSPLGGAAQ
jgi:hypothetical protein